MKNLMLSSKYVVNALFLRLGTVYLWPLVFNVIGCGYDGALSSGCWFTQWSEFGEEGLLNTRAKIELTLSWSFQDRN